VGKVEKNASLGGSNSQERRVFRHQGRAGLETEKTCWKKGIGGTEGKRMNGKRKKRVSGRWAQPAKRGLNGSTGAGIIKLGGGSQKKFRDHPTKWTNGPKDPLKR